MATTAENLPTILTIPELDLEHLDKVREVALQLFEDAEGFAVTDDATYDAALQIHDVVKLREKAIEEHRKSITDPINRSIHMINDEHNQAKAPLTKVRELLAKRAGMYFQARKAKVEAEERRKAEVLARRQEKAVEKAMERGEEVTPIVAAPTPMVSAPEKTSRSEVATGTWRENVTFEITNEAALPREYLTPDLVKIGKVIKAGIEIAGVTRKVEMIRSTRAV
jgi:hypothetical protein